MFQPRRSSNVNVGYVVAVGAARVKWHRRVESINVVAGVDQSGTVCFGDVSFARLQVVRRNVDLRDVVGFFARHRRFVDRCVIFNCLLGRFKDLPRANRHGRVKQSRGEGSDNVVAEPRDETGRSSQVCFVTRSAREGDVCDPFQDSTGTVEPIAVFSLLFLTSPWGNFCHLLPLHVREEDVVYLFPMSVYRTGKVTGQVRLMFALVGAQFRLHVVTIPSYVLHVVVVGNVNVQVLRCGKNLLVSGTGCRSLRIFVFERRVRVQVCLNEAVPWPRNVGVANGRVYVQSTVLF